MENVSSPEIQEQLFELLSLGVSFDCSAVNMLGSQVSAAETLNMTLETLGLKLEHQIGASAELPLNVNGTSHITFFATSYPKIVVVETKFLSDNETRVPSGTTYVIRKAEEEQKK